MDSSKFATVSNISGNMPLAEWTDFTVRQERAKTEMVLWRQSTSAAGQGNLSQAQQYADLAQNLSGSGYTMANLVNGSSYRVMVLDGPFKGSVLVPGASTNEKRLPVGSFSFTIMSGSSSGHDITANIFRQVSVGDKTITLFDKRY
jgi:hypothetical protein